ncbi:MAG: acetate kinase [Cellvibrionaceae bacterium]|jgi:acetate kinase
MSTAEQKTLDNNILDKKKACLTLNAGSSTLKFALFEPFIDTLKRRYSGLIDYGLGTAQLRLYNAAGETIHSANLEKKTGAAEQAIDCIETMLPDIQISTVSHRLVHGGQQFFDAIQIDAENLDQLKALTPLAPLHLPAEIRAIEALLKRLPGIPQVAYFDTAFHRNISDLAKMLPLPRSFFDEGIIRYGFHGLSYEYITSILPVNHGLTIVAHLGSGASACAIKDGKSVAHSMGFSTNEGLMMSKRSGSIDPGVVLYLLEEKNYSIADVHSILFDQSGLLGVSGISGDIRELESSCAEEAQFAIDFFCYRTAAEISKLLPALGGINRLVFTAGIGENSALVRQKICAYLQWLGLTIDDEANRQHASIISTTDSRVTVQVIATDEESVLASKAQAFTL